MKSQEGSSSFISLAHFSHQYLFLSPQHMQKKSFCITELRIPWVPLTYSLKILGDDTEKTWLLFLLQNNNTKSCKAFERKRELIACSYIATLGYYYRRTRSFITPQLHKLFPFFLTIRYLSLALRRILTSLCNLDVRNSPSTCTLQVLRENKIFFSQNILNKVLSEMLSSSRKFLTCLIIANSPAVRSTIWEWGKIGLQVPAVWFQGATNLHLPWSVPIAMMFDNTIGKSSLRART